MSRQIHFDNGAPPQPAPIQMEDLLNSAQTDWKFKRKDEAFVKVLGALAMMSQGVAQGMKTAEKALREVEELRKELREGGLTFLPPPSPLPASPGGPSSTPPT